MKSAFFCLEQMASQGRVILVLRCLSNFTILYYSYLHKCCSEQNTLFCILSEQYYRTSPTQAACGTLPHPSVIHTIGRLLLYFDILQALGNHVHYIISQYINLVDEQWVHSAAENAQRKADEQGSPTETCVWPFSLIKIAKDRPHNMYFTLVAASNRQYSKQA